MPSLKSFSDLRARPFLAEQLMRPVETGRIVHAQLFQGPKGVGKHSAAELCARAVNCTGESTKPCNACASCLQFLSGNSTRLISVSPEKSAIRVDAVREIIEKINLRPASGKLCVIIDDAHLMNENAQNALLKTLEECPDYCVFFLITDKPDALLPTIRSRCSRYRFAPLGDNDVAEILAEMGVDTDTAESVAPEAGGSAGKAYESANDENYSELRRRAVRALLSAKKPSRVAAAFNIIKDDKDDARRILDIYETLARRLMLVSAGAKDNDDENVNALIKGGVRGENLLYSSVECARRLSSNVSYQSAMEMLFFDMARQEE